ncbi:hypothetical protein TCAL_13976, partial [Tigriopus californicus]
MFVVGKMSAIAHVRICGRFFSFVETSASIGGITNLESICSHKVRRFVYINSSVEPYQCDCEHLVLSLLSFTQLEADAICPRCQCNFEIRNLGMIKLVAILVIWIVMILLIYMASLTEDEDIDMGEHLAHGTPKCSYRSPVINRMGNQQSWWKNKSRNRGGTSTIATR